MTPRRRRRSSSFNFDAKRRREIERHARHVGAAETEDLERWLIAWAWHNSQSTDPLAALQNAAVVMGERSLSDAEAEHILEQAKTIRRRRRADSLGRWLGLTYRDREKLKITSIGAKDIGKRARKELRKRANRLYLEKRRRSRGVRPRHESLSKTKPWKTEGISRASWYRKRHETNRKAALLNSHNGNNDNERRETTRKAALLSIAHVVSVSQTGATNSPSSVFLPSISASFSLSSSRRATLPVVFRPGWRRDKLAGELQSPTSARVTIRELWPPVLGPPGDDVFALIDGGAR